MTRWDAFTTKEIETLWSGLNAFTYRYHYTVMQQDLKQDLTNELEKRYRGIDDD